jgi:hypothetical protein
MSDRRAYCLGPIGCDRASGARLAGSNTEAAPNRWWSPGAVRRLTPGIAPGLMDVLEACPFRVLARSGLCQGLCSPALSSASVGLAAARFRSVGVVQADVSCSTGLALNMANK